MLDSAQHALNNTHLNMSHTSESTYHRAYDTLPTIKDPRPGAVDTFFKQHLHSAPYHEILESINTASLLAGLPDIACSAPQAKLLMLQARMCRARHVLEIGTLGGYSAAWLATASPNTRVTTIEIDRTFASIARANLEKAKLIDRVEILQGSGLDVLGEIKRGVDTGERARFDFVFIDANKQDNLAYLDAVMGVTKSGAVIVVDNVVRDGKVVSAEEAEMDDRVKGTRELICAMGKMENLEATAIQTVGEKNYDGFLIAIRQ